MRTPDSWQTARATVAIALVTVFAYLVLSIFRLEMLGIQAGSFIPLTLTVEAGFFRLPFALTPLSATLLHAGLLHLVFNMLMLLICGRAVEGALGPLGLVILYIVGAFAAAAGQFVLDPASPAPMIGASGAVSAVIGAYAMLFGRNRVPIANPTLALWVNVLWLLAAWIVLQLAMGLVFSAGGGILLAVGAHIGGFIAGVILARPLLLWRYRKA